VTDGRDPGGGGSCPKGTDPDPRDYSPWSWSTGLGKEEARWMN